jgi:dTDP-glucose 4,6-dehydratase
MKNGTLGETYNIGGENEWENIHLVKYLCKVLGELTNKPGEEYEALITFVQDRLGHDRRYAINCDKLKKELGWKQSVTFEEGLKMTVQWYLNHLPWAEEIRSGEYQEWIAKNYES